MEHYYNYINNTWTASSDGETNKHYNPSNPSECIGTTEMASKEDVDHAIESAKEASLRWKETSSVERGEYLRKAADILENKADEIAMTATKEMGKCITETKQEVARAATILRYYGQDGMREIGSVLPSSQSGKTLYSVRVPLGVVAVITPWNFPIAIPIWKIAPALVYGNTVVWKPSRENSITAVKIAQIFEEANLPAGVLHLVNGSGSKVGDALTEHKDVAGVSFTGSNAIGQHIASKAVARNKKYQLEMGGKNPIVVLGDADVEKAATLTLDGAMKQTGQRCTAASRVYVENSIFEEFKEKLLEKVKKIKIGDGADETITMGPIVSGKQFDSVLSYIEKGKEEGATLLYGGKSLKEELNNGYFIEPAIFTDVTEEMTIAKEEIFGPVLCMMKIDSYEEGVEKANNTEFGLSAAIFTTSLEKALDFTQKSEVGMVHVNGETGGAEPQAPFGGTKESSAGPSEQGQAAVEFYTELKTVSISK
ncbi:aldehyde dehydrogenase family protein [Alteribacillus iranensis]|uniref:Aldehyde dehydrogenase (NAD+) n=1 Tax=Alteribacillus iranensis TaxID=930128 RepID=A0A1I2CT05_9BACI|nr:aldehyde dehydrogenase family protein [Alteribacillus iranensis]SFE71477.1 aldehyde dehydrogenase (NAD+) [Alteribacillus iranensis]